MYRERWKPLSWLYDAPSDKMALVIDGARLSRTRDQKQERRSEFGE